jgi:uncharacterized membrane protein YkoI
MTLLSVGMLIAATGAALADEGKRVSLDKVPAVAKAAADKAIPGVTWKAAEQETEGGTTVYELKGHDPKGERVEVEVSPDGNQVTVEH